MKESGTLGNNFITSLYEDCLGQIWIGTDVGVYIYSPSGEKVERFVIQSNLNTTIEQTVHTIKGDRKEGSGLFRKGKGFFVTIQTEVHWNIYRLMHPERNG